MMMKRTDTDPELLALTRAEIARQIGALVERRQQIANRRADLYLRSSKSGAPAASLSVEEKAARAHAKGILKGDAPPSLDPPSELDFSSLDMGLAVEQRGIDIAIKNS